MHGYCSDITRMFVGRRTRAPRCATRTRCSSKPRRPACRAATVGARVRGRRRRRPPGDHRRRLRRLLRAPHRSRHRRRGPRGPVRGRRATRRRSCPATRSAWSPGSTSRALRYCGSRTSWSRPTPGPSASTTPRRSPSSTRGVSRAARSGDGARAVGDGRPVLLLGDDPTTRGRHRLRLAAAHLVRTDGGRSRWSPARATPGTGATIRNVVTGVDGVGGGHRAAPVVRPPRCRRTRAPRGRGRSAPQRVAR